MPDSSSGIAASLVSPLPRGWRLDPYGGDPDRSSRQIPLPWVSGCHYHQPRVSRSHRHGPIGPEPERYKPGRRSFLSVEGSQPVFRQNPRPCRPPGEPRRHAQRQGDRASGSTDAWAGQRPRELRALDDPASGPQASSGIARSFSGSRLRSAGSPITPHCRCRWRHRTHLRCRGGAARYTIGTKLGLAPSSALKSRAGGALDCQLSTDALHRELQTAGLRAVALA